MYPVEGPTELEEVSQGFQVILDGQLLRHNGALLNPESEVGPWASKLDFILANFKACQFNDLTVFQSHI